MIQLWFMANKKTCMITKSDNSSWEVEDLSKSWIIGDKETIATNQMERLF